MPFDVTKYVKKAGGFDVTKYVRPKEPAPPTEPGGVGWGTTVPIAAGAAAEGVGRSLFNLGRLISPFGRTLPEPENLPALNKYSALAGALKPGQNIAQNALADAMQAAPYFTPVAGQVLFGADVATKPESAVEMVKEVPRSMKRLATAPFSAQSREELKQNLVPTLISAGLPIAIATGIAAKGRGAIRSFVKPREGVPVAEAMIKERVGPGQIRQNRILSSLKELPEETPETPAETTARVNWNIKWQRKQNGEVVPVDATAKTPLLDVVSQEKLPPEPATPSVPEKVPLKETPQPLMGETAELPQSQESRVRVVNKYYKKWQDYATSLSAEIYKAEKSKKSYNFDLEKYEAPVGRTTSLAEAKAWLDIIVHDKLPELAGQIEQFEKSSPGTELGALGTPEPPVKPPEPPIVEPPKAVVKAPEPQPENISKLALRTEADAIEAKLTESFADLPEYKTMNMKEQAQRAKETLDADYDKAKRMAMGEEPVPPGIRDASIYEAVKIRALKEGDVETLRQLAVESKLPGKLTEYGQAIKAADSNIMDDPVKAMQDIGKTRAAESKRTRGFLEKKHDAAEIERLKGELAGKEKAYTDLLAQKKLIRQPATYGARNKIVTTEAYEGAKAELRKQFAGTKLTVGVDPAAIANLGKIGAYHFEAGLRGFERWSIQMAEDVGEWVKPHLAELWVDVSRARKDQIYLKSQKTRYANELRKLNEKLDNLDFQKVERRINHLDPEARRLKTEYDRARENYRAAVNAAGTVTKEEATQIVELSKRTADLKEKLIPGSKQGRLEYGAARVQYENYINSLKGENAPIKEMVEGRVGEFKTTWGRNKPKAVLDLSLDAAKTIADNSVSAVAAWDDSFVGRQGIFTLMTHPTKWWDGASNSVMDFAKVIGGKNAHDALMADVYSCENYLNGYYQKAKILNKYEEQFPTTLPERVPLAGRVYKASEQAFTGSAIRMRKGILDLLVKNAAKNGVEITDSWLSAQGKMINSLTARGALGRFGEGGVVRLVLWAPRMIKGNFDVLTMHMGGAGLEHPAARLEAAKNLSKIVAEMATIMLIANALKPGSAEYNPQSSDFGKIKVGNTRFDFTGGAGSMVVLAARLITNGRKMAETGAIKPYGAKYGQPSRFDAIINYLANKTNPPTRLFVDLLRGKNFRGQPFSWPTAGFRLVMPITAQNAWQLKDDASADAVVGVIADGFGISANTYQMDKPEKRYETFVRDAKEYIKAGDIQGAKDIVAKWNTQVPAGNQIVWESFYQKTLADQRKAAAAKAKADAKAARVGR